MKIRKLLIANRGEIASRIIRSCKKLNIKTVLIYSEEDAYNNVLKECDESVLLPGVISQDTYLNMDAIIKAAKQTNCQAIHPGFGFLSENAEFAQKVLDSNLIFVGPRPEVIQQMGSKAKAKQLLSADKSVPLIPGYDGDDQSLGLLISKAKNIGFPLLVKASAGGGGKGMRIVRNVENLESAIDTAKREAKLYFGDDHLVIEKYFENIRHIEVQIMGDNYGNLIHIFERECSIQRRHQKIIEESPSSLAHRHKTNRRKILECAKRIGQLLNYNNAGTVEFIYNDRTESFYFLEVNTRLQVEHPVTEEVTGLDLVSMQLFVADGQKLSTIFESTKYKSTSAFENGNTNGHAIEIRLYAENPEANFAPSPGKIVKFLVPPESNGRRYELGVDSGSNVSIYYDPMIAKLIVHGNSREEAIKRMIDLLSNTTCMGIATNKAYLISMLKYRQFKSYSIHTNLVAQTLDMMVQQLQVQQRCSKTSLFLAVLLLKVAKNLSNRTLFRHVPLGWHSNDRKAALVQYFKCGSTYHYISYRLNESFRGFLGIHALYGGQDYSVNMYTNDSDNDVYRIEINGLSQKFCILNHHSSYFVSSPSHPSINFLALSARSELDVYLSKNSAKTDTDDGNGYVASLPAKVLEVKVEDGAFVKKGQVLVIIESMKMEVKVLSKSEGIVSIYVKPEQLIEEGFQIVDVKLKA